MRAEVGSAKARLATVLGWVGTLLTGAAARLSDAGLVIGDAPEMTELSPQTDIRLSWTDEPIDAVIAWVDGADPDHVRKRVAYQRLASEAHQRLVGNAVADNRFVQSDEIRYCVRSLRNHAPWIRTIYLVTDRQFPDCFDRAEATRHGIRVIDHQDLFDNQSATLPTFNSLAIETQLWRIPELSERFIYLNDDMFLTGPAKPEDFFTQDGVILRGRWSKAPERLPRQLHPRVLLNGARMMGFTQDYYFTSHVAYPMLKSTFAGLHEKFGREMERNAAFRFRHIGQFWPISLHAHALIAENRATTVPNEMIYITSGAVDRDSPKRLREQLGRIASHSRLGACINDFRALEMRIPDARDYLDRATGPALPFERPNHAPLIETACSASA